MYRCVPDPTALFGGDNDDDDDDDDDDDGNNTAEAQKARQQKAQAATGELVIVINTDELVRKVLSDLYNSWREMLILCAISVGEWYTGGRRSTSRCLINLVFQAS